ncbi:MAG: alpha/beta fold hydrolase [Anaerolineales bacterium]|nr:alpha/beta fold hydrolase [Anaerolineales bacterium]
MSIIQHEGEPFLFQRGRIGCILVHGFSGAPKEMRWLGEHLASEDFSVLGVRLFAHATKQEDMIRARWYDWLASVEDAYYTLYNICDHIVILGLSMGGALSLIFASRFSVTGVIACSTPYKIPDRKIRVIRPMIPLISKVWRFAPKDETEWVEPGIGKDHLEYRSYPVRGGAEFLDLLRELRACLPQVKVPTLLIHSTKDASVPYQDVKKIYNALGSEDKELITLENCGHVVTRDAERHVVFNAAVDFFRKVTTVDPYP